MYCIKCGVRLSDGQTVCPLCHTRVYHPELSEVEIPTYPKRTFVSEEFNRKGLLFVITVLCLLPLLLPMTFELLWHGSVGWSGYVTGGVLLSYVWLILPCWFKRPNPTIFVPCGFAAAIVYLCYINLQTGGDWFLPFAFPVAGSLGVIVTAIVTLCHYFRGAGLYVFGGGLIGLGIWTVLIEFLIWVTFDHLGPIRWSMFSFLSLFVLGMMLIVISIVKPLKESLYKIFFIG